MSYSKEMKSEVLITSVHKGYSDSLFVVEAKTEGFSEGMITLDNKEQLTMLRDALSAFLGDDPGSNKAYFAAES